MVYGINESEKGGVVVNLFSPTLRSLSFSPSGDMLAVGGARHTRLDDAMSPNKLNSTRWMFFLDDVVPANASLLCGQLFVVESQDMEPTVTV